MKLLEVHRSTYKRSKKKLETRKEWSCFPEQILTNQGPILFSEELQSLQVLHLEIDQIQEELLKNDNRSPKFIRAVQEKRIQRAKLEKGLFQVRALYRYLGNKMVLRLKS